MNKMDTKSFNFNKSINSYIESKKFSKFLPVQEESIPQLLKRKNSFVESPTGTGKTLSFLIPILNNLDLNNKSIQGIVIAPTKELATQIHNVLKEMKEFFDEEIYSVLAIGGEDFYDQSRKINNGTQIIVGTTDRITNLKLESKMDLTNLKYLIIDEVDMILNFGSFEEIQILSKDIPYKTTLGFFSASFPLEVQNFIKKLFNKEINNIIIKEKEDAELISHYIKAFDSNKLYTLKKLIKSNTFNPYFCLIFAKSHDEVDKLYRELKNMKVKDIGYFTSDLTQRERNRLLKQINNGDLIYLVTTDLMSRGMDFPGVTHIVNYSLPVDLTYYKHRVGRTNRNSVKGNIYDIYIDSDVVRYNEISKKNQNIIFEKTTIK